MFFVKTHRTLSRRCPLLRRASSLAAEELLSPTAETRALSSIFSKPKPAAAASLPPKPTSPKSTTEKGRRAVRGTLPSDSKPPSSTRYRPMEEKEFPATLSPGPEMLVRRLQEEGYLDDANFLHGGPLDPQRFPANLYSRHFLKRAAEKFGHDRQEIAKWLSGSDLKKVALFGCPSVETKTVFAAKRLRSFFNIQEDIICRGCKLKMSCKFMNQSVGGQHKVILADVMRVVTLFAVNSVPRQLLISEDFKLSVDKLLKEVVNLTA